MGVFLIFSPQHNAIGRRGMSLDETSNIYGEVNGNT